MEAAQNQPQPPKKKNTRLYAILAIIVVIIIIGVIAGLSYSPAPTINITEVTEIIKYPAGENYNTTFGPYFGEPYHNYSAPTIINNQITWTIALLNVDPNASHTVNSITVTTPGFKIVSISPPTPQTVASAITFDLTISVPNSNYNGPLTIVINVS